LNSQIEAWRVQAYAANVYQLSQQRGSKLAALCRKESFVGKAQFFDRLGLATAIDKTGRNEDTPNLDIEHSRRMLTTVTRHWGTLVDNKDKLQNIHSPENEYSVAAQNALGRKMDSVIVSAAFGTAYAGESGGSSVTLGTTQKIASVASAAIDYANVQLLRKAKYRMDAAEVQGQRYIVHSAKFLEQLLARTEVTSSDYNTVRALVAGAIDTFLGFKFIHCELVDDTTAANLDSDSFAFNTTTGLYDSGGTAISGQTHEVALCIAEGGVILGENVGGRMAKIEPRADKGYSMQVYAAQDFGATRMEEAKVVQLIYKA
jgi:hypothetical protein